MIGLKEGGDACGVRVSDTHLRHGRARMDLLRVLDPVREILGRILQRAREVRALREIIERRANLAHRAGDLWNHVAGRAAILDHQVRSAGLLGGTVRA